MYCGHFGIGLGAKGLRTSIPLSLLLFAAFGPDWVETGCMLLGLPHTSMLSHSVPSVLVLTLVLTLATAIARRSWRDALVIGALVLSHIGVDWITGRKPSWPGGPYLGAHIYVNPLADFLAELSCLAAGWLIYRRSLGAKLRNHPALIGLLVVLVSIQAVFDLFLAH